MIEMKMLKVIGLGNILRGDDGVGPVIIQKIENKASNLSIKAIDAGSDAFLILDHLLESDPVLIVDCAKMGADPGTINLFSADTAEKIPANIGLSLHGFSLAEVWKIAREMGTKVNLKIIGVEPKQISFNSGLSLEVEKSIPTIIDMVMEEARKNAEKNSHH